MKNLFNKLFHSHEPPRPEAKITASAAHENAPVAQETQDAEPKVLKVSTNTNTEQRPDGTTVETKVTVTLAIVDGKETETEEKIVVETGADGSRKESKTVKKKTHPGTAGADQHAGAVNTTNDHMEQAGASAGHAHATTEQASIPAGHAFKPSASVYSASNQIYHVTDESGYTNFEIPGQEPVVISTCKGNKKALLIGINYFGTKSELKGCINDVKNIRNLITTNYGFTECNMVVLTDDQQQPDFIPTKRNILNAMRWLVFDAQPGDSLFFHFSGHGGQLLDLEGIEWSGMDETIFPVDYKENGQIIDNVLHDLMVQPLPTGVRLTAVFDCCHSGTVLDVPYIYKCTGDIEVHTDKAHHEAALNLFQASQEFKMGDKSAAFELLKEGLHTLREHAYADLKRKDWAQEHTTLADVIQFSGCRDSQVQHLN